MRQLSKWISQESTERVPTLSSLRPTLNPGVSVGNRTRLMPPWPSGPVRTARVMKSAKAALVMQVVWPLMPESPPSFFAVVRMLATSEPAPGSETPRAATFSPRTTGARNSSFCSLLPI